MSGFHRPPRALRRPGVQLDNIALVPASLLPLRAQYQAIANALPKGDVLIVLPDRHTPEQHTLETAAQLWRAKGRHVTTLTASQVARRPSSHEPRA